MAGDWPGSGGLGDSWDESEPLVRPYAVTRGRTAPAVPLELVALVATTDSGMAAIRRRGRLAPEEHDIAILCMRIHSIAEISARLKLPLMVVRVLIDDMARDGMVSVHRPENPDRPSPELLRRVLHGLTRL
ncbi:DUF742 domain-containing protein [Frankia sp. Mgl5]|uniref:DUF742 domain-containing protein n=1 Tax=Frankia sp. Mgl5 TaxID=2933793 RepID=UPI00200C668E|nr:DUF742 domain-containing protein [Frankia sp. Mgl5]MCK9930019.1 DUF742 domain-containing protein [Frankia sp. Mgl5]